MPGPAGTTRRAAGHGRVVHDVLAQRRRVGSLSARASSRRAATPPCAACTTTAPAASSRRGDALGHRLVVAAAARGPDRVAEPERLLGGASGRRSRVRSHGRQPAVTATSGVRLPFVHRDQDSRPQAGRFSAASSGELRSGSSRARPAGRVDAEVRRVPAHEGEAARTSSSASAARAGPAVGSPRENQLKPALVSVSRICPTKATRSRGPPRREHEHRRPDASRALARRRRGPRSTPFTLR